MVVPFAVSVMFYVEEFDIKDDISIVLVPYTGQSTIGH